MKNTKEKWTTSPSSSRSASGWTAIELNGDTVAEVYGSTIESQELARLLSSAPEMLEMLKKLHESCPNHRGNKRRKLSELIAKAGGE